MVGGRPVGDAPFLICGPAGRAAFSLLSSSKDVSCRPCGAGSFLPPRRRRGVLFPCGKRTNDSATATSSGRAELIVHDRSMRSLHDPAPSRDVPSLENPSHYGGYCFLRFHCGPSGLERAAPMDRAKRLFEDVVGRPYRTALGTPGAVAVDGPPSRLYPFNRPAGGVGQLPSH